MHTTSPETRARRVRRVQRLAALCAIVSSLGWSEGAAAQWSTVYEQFYLPASHNWVFRTHYPAADRLFNAFDYGHAVLYETLWRSPDADPQRLEQREFDFVTKKLLVSPPPLPLEERAIEPLYARLAPEAKAMFDWAHLLHRQVYDVLADERLNAAQRDARIAELQSYYLTRKDLAFSTKPKSMALMQEQPYSLAFRQRYPKFNGLIWAYHWMQVGLYEPLVEGTSLAERQAGVAATIARFRQLIADAPNSTPYVMPMTSAISPRFAARYPEIAIIFDNLHSMHDVISDILANPSVPRNRKRAEILLAAQRYRDDTTEVMTVPAWRTMSAMMGVQNMGGVATGIVGAPPTPTVARGAVMRHDVSGNIAAGEHAEHDMSAMTKPDSLPRRDSTAAGDEHAGHDLSPSKRDTAAAHEDDMHRMHEMKAMNEMHAMHASPNDSLAVDSVVASFHRALAAGDSTAALSLLAADVTIQESGEAESKEEYRSSHLAGDIEFAKSVKSERSPRRIAVRGTTAWVTSSSHTVGTFHGRAIDSIGEELMVLTREGSSWRIVAIHWSSRARRKA